MLLVAYRWYEVERYVQEVLSKPPIVQQALAGQLCRRLIQTNGELHFDDYPWGTAAISEDQFVAYWRIICKRKVLSDTPIKHLRKRLPLLSTATATILIREAIQHFEPVVQSWSPSYQANVHALYQLAGDGVRTVVEDWQAPFFGRGSIVDLVDHALTYKGARPTQKWLNKAEQIVPKTDAGQMMQACTESLDIISKRAYPVAPHVSEQLRGLLLSLAFLRTPESLHVLGLAMRVLSEKIPGIGARSEKGFSGAVMALEHMGTFDALATLAIGRTRIQSAKLATLVENTLRVAAAAQGLTLEELEERVIPDFGMDTHGVCRHVLGGDAAELRLGANAKPEILWYSGEKLVSAPPKAMKDRFSDEVAALKRQKKDMESSISAQKRRLDHQFLSRRRVPYAEWKLRYVDHPLMAPLTNRLIWEFVDGEREFLAVPRDGVLVLADGSEHAPPSDGCTVKLWHPISSSDEVAGAWRDWLFSNEITQPLKQAFREIYILTPAEERTDTYSNRFAAQIIRQHQAVSLMRERGWKAKLCGYFDGGDESYPSRALNEWSLKAEFFIEVVGEEMTDAGIAKYVSTDQFRFVHNDAPVALQMVPAIVFSEICRDVDLFVGVATIGNDPMWEDQGQRTVFTQARWHDASFGDLTQQAETRKAVLERLLPRLKISKVSHLDGKFLYVKGTRHTYKIHLGSGNILIEPSGKYLCIVPGGKSEYSNIYLPFEGDRTLSIILSKAEMLAKDHAITDTTILRQL